jgi:hypothetical protein
MFLVKITSFLGGKRAIKSLGAFCLVAFGIPSIILSLQMEHLQPQWPLWVFYGGTILGIVLLIGGLFAIDVNENK